MKHSLAVVLFVGVWLAVAVARNDYLWGTIGPNDYLISKETVSKAFFVGLTVSKKYVYKQKDNLNALTITAVKVVDRKKKNGATCELRNGGPGSKGVTLVFKSERGSSIKDVVEIYGR